MRDIYRLAFANPTYSQHPADEPRYVFAVQFAERIGARSIHDIGAGRQALCLAVPQGLAYFAYDLENYADGNRFTPHDSTEIDLMDGKALTFFGEGVVACLDVLEHLPESHIEIALRTLRTIAPAAAIAVSNHSDVLDGVQLHLTQKPSAWWRDMIAATGWNVTERKSHDPRAYFFEATA